MNILLFFFFPDFSEVGGVGGVGRVQAGVHLRLLQRQTAAPGAGAVASGTAAVGAGGGDVAQEAGGVDTFSKTELGLVTENVG